MAKMSSPESGGAAAKAVQSTAGVKLTPAQVAGLQGLRSALAPYAAAAAQQGVGSTQVNGADTVPSYNAWVNTVNPGAYTPQNYDSYAQQRDIAATLHAGATDPKVGAYLTAMANAAKQQQATAPQPAADPQSYLQQILGAAPTAPTAADFGPAPTLADFFSAAPYQQALAAVAQGQKTATGSINDAFNQAGQQQAATQAFYGNQNKEFQQQQQAALANENNQINGYIQQALKLSGPGSGVQASLSPLQADVAMQNASQNNTLADLGQLAQMNNSGFTQALQTNHQGSLNALASAVAAENSKINLQQAADQAKAEQELASANSARGTAMAKANSDYQNALQTYNGNAAKVMGDAYTAAVGAAPSSLNAARDTIAEWATRAGAGDQNAADLNQKATAIFGGTLGGQTQSAPKSQADAVNRLNNMAPAMGGRGSIEYNILAGLIGEYYSGGKAPPNVNAVLQQWAQAGY